jgi:hypothetical protein
MATRLLSKGTMFSTVEMPPERVQNISHLQIRKREFYAFL